jgi:hypothetical protein
MWYDSALASPVAGQPSLTAVAVLTLALGIATNATVFSWVDSLLLHPFGSHR